MRRYLSRPIRCEEEEEIQQEERGLVTFDVERKVIYFDGVIEPDSHYLFNACVDQLMEAYTVVDEETGEETNELDEINVKIDTIGGSLNAGIQIIEEFNRLKSKGIKINTYAMENCASCGCFLLINGDKRYAYPNAHIMAHRSLLEAKEGTAITYDALSLWKDDLDESWTPIKNMIKRLTDTPDKEFKKMDKGESLAMTPLKALEYKYVDEILSL